MIKNTARPRGRPRSFDETGALEKATQVFWSKGYDGVTIDDLVAGMGVGRPSLYAVFGDKRAIFLRVLKAYAERKGASAAKALLSPQGILFRLLMSGRFLNPGHAAPGDDDLTPALSGKSAGCRITEPGGGAGDECDRMFHGRLRGEG